MIFLSENKFDNEKHFREAEATIVLTELFGQDYAGEVSFLFDRNNMLAQETKPLGDNIVAWVFDPHPERLRSIATAYAASR